MLTILLSVIICICSVVDAAAQGKAKAKDKDKEKDAKTITAAVVVLVTGDSKAVQNANVLLTTTDDSYNESLFTDKRGRAQFSGVPVGDIALQVIASGWKTHGSTKIVKAPSSHFNVTLEHKPAPRTTSDSDRR
ncbi:MAG TPA: carboxypeptidase-like regulatory domain-containing protein [Thermoanaerobaculia bacterium]|jgi:hypothetical protein